MSAPEEDLDVPEPIPHRTAVAEVYLHTMTRGAQAGGILLPLLALPLCIYRGTRGGLLLRRLGQASLLGSLGGGAFLAVGTQRKLAGSGAYGAYDRAYRLRHNHGQKLLDQLSYGSASLGLFVGTVLLNKGLWGGIVGLSSGLSLGVVEFVGLKTYQKYVAAGAPYKEKKND